MIPIIAILFASGASSNEVGVGAILGAPFMLATLAMFVTGVAVLYAARRRTTGDTMKVDTGVLAHDMRYFAIAYALAIGAAFLPLEPVWLKWIVAVVLIGIYGWYVKGHFEADPDVDAEDLAPLRFHRLDRNAHRVEPAIPRLRVVNLQVIAALGLIVLGAVFFVNAVEHIATQFNVDSTLLALVIAPIATELPEKFNSIIWVRQGKDTLAMGNITGAMVFQSCIPTVVALALRVRLVGRRAGVVRGLRLGRHRLPLVGGDLHPDGPTRRPARQEPARRRTLLRRLSRAGRRGHHRGGRRRSARRPTDILERPHCRSPADVDREVRRRSGAGPASRTEARSARRPRLLLRGRLGRHARCQGQHHDPRVHVRDGDLRGHPGVLERGPGRALRAEDPRARRAHPPVVPDPDDGERPVGRRADPADRRDGPAQRLPRGRLHPPVVLQVDLARSASGCTTSPTSCTSSRCRSGTTSTPNPASGS